MAGPSTVSGVAGSFGTIQAPDYSPIAKAIGSIVAAHETAKQHAAQDFDRLMKAMDMGLPVDPGQISKTLKKAGIKLMSPDQMKAFMEGQKNGTDPTTNPPTTGTGDAGINRPSPTVGDKGISQTLGPVGDSGINRSPTAAVGNVKQRQTQARDSVLDGFVRNALNNARLKNETAENQAKLANKLSELKLQAVSDDPKMAANAVGQLMGINEIPYNVNALAWQKATPAQRDQMMEVARGAETPAQFEQRKTGIYNSLMAEGKFKDPSMGMKAAEVIAKGGEMPSDVRAAMVPNTFTDLVKSAQLANELVMMGVPPDQVGTVSQNAQLVGLENALPKGINPLELRKVKAEETRTQVEVQRYNAEIAHYQSMAAAAAEKALKDESAADLNEFKSLAELKRINPSAVTDDMIKAAQVKAMKAMGWTPEETKGFWNYITFGLIPTKNIGFRPSLSQGGQGKIDSAIGGKAASDQSTQSTVGAIAGAVKKGIAGGETDQ